LISVALLSLGVSTAVEAGSARAVFTVSATVIANCATRGTGIVTCTKGVISPKTVTIGKPDGPASAPVSSSMSKTGQPRTLVVTENY
jgi:hypothetical protein